jgi:phage FluMu protein Com
MTVECGICGEPLEKSREADFTRYRCARCQIFYYVYAPTEPPHQTGVSQEMEKPSIFALLFPFMVVSILELLYHFFG